MYGVCIVFDLHCLPSGADDISLDGSGKQLIVVLLPDDDNEERAFLEQGVCLCVREGGRERERLQLLTSYTSSIILNPL